MHDDDNTIMLTSMTTKGKGDDDDETGLKKGLATTMISLYYHTVIYMADFRPLYGRQANGCKLDAKSLP